MPPPPPTWYYSARARVASISPLKAVPFLPLLLRPSVARLNPRFPTSQSLPCKHELEGFPTGVPFPSWPSLPRGSPPPPHPFLAARGSSSFYGWSLVTPALLYHGPFSPLAGLASPPPPIPVRDRRLTAQQPASERGDLYLECFYSDRNCRPKGCWTT